MILSNHEIHRALDEGRLVIDPEPEPRQAVEGQTCPYDTHSVDLGLASEIIIPQGGPYTYDPAQSVRQADFTARNSKRLTIAPEMPYRLARN